MKKFLTKLKKIAIEIFKPLKVDLLYSFSPQASIDEEKRIEETRLYLVERDKRKIDTSVKKDLNDFILYCRHVLRL